MPSGAAALAAAVPPPGQPWQPKTAERALPPMPAWNIMQVNAAPQRNELGTISWGPLRALLVLEPGSSTK